MDTLVTGVESSDTYCCHIIRLFALTNMLSLKAAVPRSICMSGGLVLDHMSSLFPTPRSLGSIAPLFFNVVPDGLHFSLKFV